MKKAILFIFSALIIGSVNTSAQTFTADKDTVKMTVYTGYGEAKNKITNTTAGNLNINWKVIYNNLPASWVANGFGICDNATCITFKNETAMADSFDAITIGAGGNMEMKLQYETTKLPSGGPYYITAKLVDMVTPSNTKNITFEISNRYSTSVSTTNRTTDVVMYPNPAHNELNVLFDGNAGIKNITVYNLIGKAVTVYKVNGNSANMDVSNIPSGIYFIRLIDAQGRVVATRKFTHQ